MRQVKTQDQSWVVSVHKIKNLFLFASADELDIKFDTSFGRKKKDGTITYSCFVKMLISLQSDPNKTILTYFTDKNGFSCLQIADDQRVQNKATSLLGLVVM